MHRAALVASAAESIARGSKSFAVASKLFDKPTRERAWLLYAWCRACDDLADGQDHGGARETVVDPQARLGTIKFLTNAALAGQTTGNPASTPMIGDHAPKTTCYAIAITSRASLAA
jgi:15-cis-phytoene synthase